MARENFSEKVTPPSLHFIVEISKHTEKFKEFYNEYSYTNLDSIINILLNMHEQRPKKCKRSEPYGGKVFGNKKNVKALKYEWDWYVQGPAKRQRWLDQIK